MKIESLRSVAVAATFVTLMLLLGPLTVVRAAGIVVTSTADTTGNGNGCTLREAIINANENAGTWSDCTAGSGADTITFGVSGTIRLGSSLPNITDAAGLTIDGAGKSVTISGDTNGDGTADVPIFILSPFSSFTLKNVTLTKGNAGSGTGGAVYIGFQASGTVANVAFSANQGSYGGAIANDRGTVAIIDSVFSANTATASGGAISSIGRMTIMNSIFSGNATVGSGSREGGAIINGDLLTVTNTTFAGNSTSGTGSGAGIYNNGGTLVIASNTFSGNQSNAYGGGIANNFGTTTVVNSTFSNNSSPGIGSGIYLYTGALTVINSTFSDNALASYSGIHNGLGTVTLQNTAVADNPPEGNCSGVITNGGHNIDSGTTCGWASNNGSMSSTNPLLASLANNGGPTQTMALQPGSPAIGAGNATVCALALPNGPGGVDQRGVARKRACDIGAFEIELAFLPLLLK